MQIKKEEMRTSLLQAGEDEFFEKGYDKANIRSIVKRAHTTIGNFYNYFDSKESLYKELVNAIYNQMTDLIIQHSDFENMDQLVKLEDLNNNEGLSDIKLWRFILKYAIDKYFPPIDRRFALLMTGSDTTPLSHARKDLANLLAAHFNEHIIQYAPDYPHKELGKMIAHQLIEGLVAIGRSNYDIKKSQELTVEQILFVVIGVMSIVKGGK